MQLQTSTTPTQEQMRQQNQTLIKSQQQHFNNQLLSSISLSRTQHPDLSSKYQGYMQIAKRKSTTNPTQEYFSSPFLRQLKQKRNNMFSDEIIEKITKQYGIKEYGTFINSITYLPVNSKGEKYGTLEFVNYEELEKRMTRA